MSCVAGKQGLNPLPSWETVEHDPLRSGKQSLDSQPFLTTRMPGFAREVLLWNRMKAKSFVTKDLVTLGIYQFDSSRLAWSTKIHCGHSNLTSPRRKVQEAPCWCGELHQITRWSCCCGPFPFQNLPPKKYLRGVEHAIPAVHSKRGYSVISVGSLGFWSRYIHHSFKENEFIVMYESTVDFKKSWEHFRSFFFSRGPNKTTHLQHVRPRLDQVRQLLQSCMKFSGGSKVGRFLEHQLSRRNRWSSKKNPCRMQSRSIKNCKACKLCQGTGKVAPFFFWKRGEKITVPCSMFSIE